MLPDPGSGVYLHVMLLMAVMVGLLCTFMVDDDITVLHPEDSQGLGHDGPGSGPAGRGNAEGVAGVYRGQTEG